MQNKIKHIESEKYRSLCFKQLGILLGSPSITLLFGYFFYGQNEIDKLFFKATLSCIFLVIAFKMIDKGYTILLRLDKRNSK